MKNSAYIIFALLLTICLLPDRVAAQNEVVVNEIREYISVGEKTGFEVAILDAKPEDVEDSWIRAMKKDLNAKVSTSRKSVEIFADNAKLETVSANTIDIYAITSMESYGTRLRVFVDLGGSFISSAEHEMAFNAFELFLKQFAHSEAIRVVEEELDEQESVLKELNKELESLIKEKQSYMKDIEKAKSNIAKYETELANNEHAQEATRETLASNAGDPDALNKQLGNLIKDREKLQIEVAKEESLISRREAEIADNIRQQEIKREQIRIQEEIVNVVQQKRQELGPVKK